ncbi:unnamed protein product [Allacma fusca]|uniref:Uncharacterized protein n=1 Tax=Allacma fusca TaxID=39272 RepID=A0A8J2PA96_9HEXA|nr:unnamed protein product [Allacma fusca]
MGIIKSFVGMKSRYIKGLGVYVRRVCYGRVDGEIQENGISWSKEPSCRNHLFQPCNFFLPTWRIIHSDIRRKHHNSAFITLLQGKDSISFLSFFLFSEGQTGTVGCTGNTCITAAKRYPVSISVHEKMGNNKRKKFVTNNKNEPRTSERGERNSRHTFTKHIGRLEGLYRLVVSFLMVDFFSYVVPNYHYTNATSLVMSSEKHECMEVDAP